MPQNKIQKLVFALLTVFITVNVFVFYNVFFVEKSSYAQYGAKTIISFLLIEFVCAITCELFIGSPFSMKLAFRIVEDPKKFPFFVTETIIIVCTVAIMCPLMSFLAVFIYNGFVTYIFNPDAFSIQNFFINFIPNWATKVFYNFPVAFFSQIFFIQPLVRRIFGIIYSNKNAESVAKAAQVTE